MSRSLIRPRSCSRINHAAVRTSSEVHSGSNTAANNRFLTQPEVEASSMA